MTCDAAATVTAQPGERHMPDNQREEGDGNARGAPGSNAPNEPTPTEEDENRRLSASELEKYEVITFPQGWQLQLRTRGAFEENCCDCNKKGTADRQQCVKTACGHFICIPCMDVIIDTLTEHFTLAESEGIDGNNYGLQKCPRCPQVLLRKGTVAG